MRHVLATCLATQMSTCIINKAMVCLVSAAGVVAVVSIRVPVVTPHTAGILNPPQLSLVLLLITVPPPLELPV